MIGFKFTTIFKLVRNFYSLFTNNLKFKKYKKFLTLNFTEFDLI